MSGTLRDCREASQVERWRSSCGPRKDKVGSMCILFWRRTEKGSFELLMHGVSKVCCWWWHESCADIYCHVTLAQYCRLYHELNFLALSKCWKLWVYLKKSFKGCQSFPYQWAIRHWMQYLDFFWRQPRCCKAQFLNRAVPCLVYVGTAMLTQLFPAKTVYYHRDMGITKNSSLSADRMDCNKSHDPIYLWVGSHLSSAEAWDADELGAARKLQVDTSASCEC